LASAVGIAAIGAVAACGSTPASQPTAAAGAPPGSAAAPAGAKAIDACALLTVDEIGQVIGAKGSNTPRSGSTRSGDNSCAWENPDTYHSITVSLGSPGTAVGGELSDESDYGQTEAGPDGIRFASGGIAEFTVDDRACEIQVVTAGTRDADRSTAVRLIGLVRDRV
jgi:hypothetical protein